MKKTAKKTSVRIAVFLSALLLTLQPVFAFSVSPGMDVIASELTMNKSGTVNTVLAFNAEDFDFALGFKVDAITIRSLPPENEGVLMLGTLGLSSGQKISRKSLSSLRFVPTSSHESQSSFTFTGGNGGQYAVTCNLYVLSGVNLAPTASLVNDCYFSCSGYRDIPLYGAMKAADPEGDALSYEIISYPKHGILSIYDVSCGSYSYTPASGYTGRDSFTYVASDCYGNRSEEIKVQLKIAKQPQGTVLSDMTGHWAYTAAVKAISSGIMQAENTEKGVIFSPDTAMTRAEFLAAAMTAAGYKVKGSKTTAFIDDYDIPADYKGYVAAAKDLGFVNGVACGGVYRFYPNEPVTRAEASVILQKIFGIETPVVKAAFADQSAVPSWASDALSSLCETGILNGIGGGNVAPYTKITRAMAAQMLTAAMAL